MLTVQLWPLPKAMSVRPLPSKSAAVAAAKESASLVFRGDQGVAAALENDHAPLTTAATSVPVTASTSPKSICETATAELPVSCQRRSRPSHTCHPCERV